MRSLRSSLRWALLVSSCLLIVGILSPHFFIGPKTKAQNKRFTAAPLPPNSRVSTEVASKVRTQNLNQNNDGGGGPNLPPGNCDVNIAPGPSPAGGYLPLSLFGIPPVAGVTDDSLTNFNHQAFVFAGQVYTRVGFSSNGYVVIGGGSGPDNSIINQNFPNPTRPNTVLALFWTNLNPAAAGALRIGTLTDGSDTWIVLDWQGVRELSNAGNLHSFQVWIGINSDAHPGEDVSYAYGPNTGNGEGGLASVGVENKFGDHGQNTYFNGTGTLPTNGTQLRVTTGPCTDNPPTITCPGSVSKFTDSGQTTATVNPGTPTASDDHSTPSITGVRNDGKPLTAPYPIGLTTINWTATDSGGNTSSCSQTIVVMAPSGQRRVP